MTKHLDEVTILKHVAAMIRKFEGRRSSTAPSIIAFCGTMLGVEMLVAYVSLLRPQAAANGQRGQ